MPKEVPTAPCRGWEGSQAGRGHPQVGCAQGGASVGAGGACLFPEPVGWGGPQREGLAGVGVLSRPAAVATPTTRPALAPSRPPRQQLTRTPPTHCCPWGAGHRRPGRGGGLTLCCAVRNRTLVGSRCLMAAGRGRLAVQVARRGVARSPGAPGIPGCGRLGKDLGRHRTLSGWSAAALWWQLQQQPRAVFICPELPQFPCGPQTCTAYSRAFTRASLASMRIWISARAASSAAPDSSDCAFSRLARAVCRGVGHGEGQGGRAEQPHACRLPPYRPGPLGQHLPPP